MKKCLLSVIALLCAAFTVPSHASNTYYLSPSGSDSAAGSITAPWLTPKHNVSCGDVLLANPGTYAASSFGSGNWGTVSCPAGIGVAWVKCATFDTCKISATNSSGMQISSNYWGVQGFEATSSYVYGSCLTASSGVNHVVYANNVANKCQAGGISLNGGDYDVIVGNIVYDGALTSDVCTSNITLWEPKQSDSLPGTHIYVAGNISYGSLNPNPCAGTKPTDGEGIIFDTFTGYTAQVVAESNLLVFNGGRGIMLNTAGPTYILHQNTLYGNNLQSGQDFPQGLGEVTVNASKVTATANIAALSQSTVNGNAIYAFSLQGSGNTVQGNLFSGATYGSGYGANVSGNPGFASVPSSTPAAPLCGGTASTIACAAQLITDFTASTAPAGDGFQLPGVSIANANFPQWMCSGAGAAASGSPGVFTPGCGVATVTPPPVVVTPPPVTPPAPTCSVATTSSTVTVTCSGVTIGTNN